MKRLSLIVSAALLALPLLSYAATSPSQAAAAMPEMDMPMDHSTTSMPSTGSTVSALPTDSSVVTVELKNMALHSSTTFVPEGKVTFVLRNADKVTHQVAVIRSDSADTRLAVGPYTSKVSSAGKVGPISELAAGATSQFTTRLGVGTYLIVCTQAGHYNAGMRTALTVGTAVDVELREMAVDATKLSMVAGKVVFAVHNVGSVTHELVVLRSNLPIDELPSDPDEAGKIVEDIHMGETGDVDPGTWNSFTLDLAPGNYILLCNEPGHYAAGMRVAFQVYGALPQRTVPIVPSDADAPVDVPDTDEEE